jgi:hypothetical protein
MVSASMTFTRDTSGVITTLLKPSTLEDDLSPYGTMTFEVFGLSSSTIFLLPVMWLVVPLSMIHFSPPEAMPYKRSILGFRSPFLDGSSFVSHKNLRYQNSIFNITIIGTNIFSIDITIIISEKHIMRIIFPCKIIMCRVMRLGVCMKITIQLGTPRGRYDEHSSKFFPQKETKVLSSRKKSVLQKVMHASFMTAPDNL